jgi:hypothetical protein
MEEFKKTVNVLEGPWEASAFPQGEETTEGVISREMSTVFKKDGYLCETVVTRNYHGKDYHDTSTHKRIVRIDG